MNYRHLFTLAIAVATFGAACGQLPTRPDTTNTAEEMKTEEDWKKELTPEQYRVLREKGTEPAFTGAYWDDHDSGTYKCAGCGQALFSSDAKFDSGTGWPSFYQALDSNAVKEIRDTSHGMVRTEVVCARCGGHLGHVFDDGPGPNGQRYCMNSCSLQLEKKQ